MPNIISDTSCLIVLSNIKQLDILRELYKIILITPEVAAEFGEPLPDWIHPTCVADPLKTRMLQNNLELGEASTIALAVELPEPLMILDDKKARRIAEVLGLQLTGTLGIIAKAYRTGLIADIAGVIADLRQSNFRIPHNFERIILNSH
jgi:predicted nucleic acid-binding protein